MTEAEFQELLLKLLTNDPTVTVVNFGPNDRPGEDKEPLLFDAKHVVQLCAALELNTECKELMIRNVVLGTEGATAIHNLVKTNTGLSILKLFNVGFDNNVVILGVDGIKLVLDAFKGISHPNLKTLKITDHCYNQQDNDKVIDLFAEMIKQNNTLISTYFSGCRITLAGFKRYVDAVRNFNTKIYNIYYDENELSDVNGGQLSKVDPGYLVEKTELENLHSLNSYLRAVRQAATMMAQASRDDEYRDGLNKSNVFNFFPKELLPVIAGSTQKPDYYFNKYSLFSPPQQAAIDQLAMNEAFKKFNSENLRKLKQ